VPDSSSEKAAPEWGRFHLLSHSQQISLLFQWSASLANAGAGRSFKTSFNDQDNADTGNMREPSTRFADVWAGKRKGVLGRHDSR
jgi:hypothetical protein